MGSKARDYKRSTIRRLDTLSGNQCAAPDCERQLLAKDGDTIVSKICHIEAASENGPRYNPNMSDDDRRHYSNLILLCDECHSIIDNKENENLYPVPMLKNWKKNHLEKNLQALQQKTSMLGRLIKSLSSIDLDEVEEAGGKKLPSFDIDEKIEFNSIKRNRSLIDEYKVFYIRIGNLYQELEANGAFKKQLLLNNVRTIYLKIKGKYVMDAENAMELIQANADNIFDDVENELFHLVQKHDSICEEEASWGICLVMVDAFMRCKILENPKLA